MEKIFVLTVTILWYYKTIKILKKLPKDTKLKNVVVRHVGIWIADNESVFSLIFLL